MPSDLLVVSIERVFRLSSTMASACHRDTGALYGFDDAAADVSGALADDQAIEAAQRRGSP